MWWGVWGFAVKFANLEKNESAVIGFLSLLHYEKSLGFRSLTFLFSLEIDENCEKNITKIAKIGLLLWEQTCSLIYP